MYNLEFGPGSLWAYRYGAANLPHGRGKLGSQNGVISAARNEPKFGVLPIVYLHAGLEIGSPIPYAIHRESNLDSHALGSQRSPCHLAW